MNSLLARRLLSHRIYLLLVIHTASFALAYSLAFAIRFDLDVPPDMRRLFWQSLLWVLPLKLALFGRFGSFHGWWRYVTFADLVVLLRVTTLSTLVIASLDYFLIPQYQIPRAVVLLDWGLALVLLGGFRSGSRMVREHLWPAVSASPRRSALIIGTDGAGEAVARQIHSHPRLDYRVVGFLDDNRDLVGSRLGGIPFLGCPDHAAMVALQRRIGDVLVMTNALSGRRLTNLIEQCRKAGVRLKMIPGVDDLLSGAYRLQVRDVEIKDILRREPVQLDADALTAMLAGRRVMVTGAGGSIGSEICRQVLRCRPSRLLLVERAECSLFAIDQELRRATGDERIVPCVADVRDRARLDVLFRRHRPEIVFHAAAHKHVPLMEENPGEAVNNNVFGTRTLADLCDAHGVERFVLISTDKAVNPTSVMGVTKLLAERYVHALSEESATAFLVVRFGNVLASAGSVVPIFQEQIRRGGPITVTHPDMRRFFMTIPEASQLVLQAGAMGRGGEIFVLDMGEPVRILDLAHDMVRLSGLAPDDIEIEITGLRPGEKLFEELSRDDELTLPTPHPKLRAAYHRPCSLAEIDASLAELAQVVHGPDQAVRSALRRLVPEYTPTLAPPVAERPAIAPAAQTAPP